MDPNLLLVFAMCTSLLMWYIVDGETPGIIVLLFVFTFLEVYVVLRYPKFIIIALLSMVTQVLIIGYELQVRKVGDEVILIQLLMYGKSLIQLRSDCKQQWPAGLPGLRACAL